MTGGVGLGNCLAGGSQAGGWFKQRCKSGVAGGPKEPRKESATEIPAMEAMAMTSLKLKLPKVLLPHFYVGARWRC